MLGWLIKPIIIKEIKKAMKDFIQPFLDLVKALVQPEQGTKFLVTVLCGGGILYLQLQGKAEWTTTTALAFMAVAYYVADYKHKNKGAGK